MEADSPSQPRPRRWYMALAAAVVLVIAILLTVRLLPHRISSEQIREQIVATIQKEARASFLVTGSLDATATITHENALTLLPGLLDVGLGTSTATVQVPGRAYYGIDVRMLRADRITVSGDTVRMTVPPPQVLSVSANLQEMKVWTKQGWLRTPTSVRDAERAAVRRVNAVLLKQANMYVASSSQPRVNTAEALQKALEPALRAAGLKHPHFIFELGDRLVRE